MAKTISVLLKQGFFNANYDEYKGVRSDFSLPLVEALSRGNNMGGLFFRPHDGGEN